MNETALVRVAAYDGVLEITLDVPPVNVIGRKSSRELYRAFKRLVDDPALRVGIITGHGSKYFSAGWDLKETTEFNLASYYDPDAGFGPGGWAGLTEFWDLNKPVVAAVNGHAIGGGFELVMSADLVVASDAADFWLPEAMLGLIPTGGGLQYLPRRLPYNVAAELLMTGKRLGARQAQEYGLVNYVVPVGEVMDKAKEIANSICRSAPSSIRAIKDLLRNTGHLSLQSAFAAVHNSAAYEQVRQSPNYREGALAFVQKRTPIWQ